MVKFTQVHHQFALFPFRDTRPKLVIPEDVMKTIHRGNKQYKKGDMQAATKSMRELGEGLERYLRKLK